MKMRGFKAVIAAGLVGMTAGTTDVPRAEAATVHYHRGYTHRHRNGRRHYHPGYRHIHRTASPAGRLSAPAGARWGPRWALYVYNQVKARFPRVRNMGIYNRRKIAGTNRWSEHAYGNAVDIGVPNLVYGDMVRRYLAGNRGRFNIRTLLWRVRSHYDHVHVDFRRPGR